MLVIVIFLMLMKQTMLYQKRMWEKQGYSKANVLNKISLLFISSL